MKPDDKQFDALLRDVSVPGELKQRLRQIPGEQPLVTRSPVVSLPPKWIAGLALAAGLAGVAVWLNWPVDNSPGPGLAAVEGAPEVATVDPQIAIDQLNLEIELLTARIRLRESEKRLAELQSANPMLELSTNDQLSLALALSDQAAMEWGANPETVRADMQKTIGRYPDSAGAKIASQFLAAADSQNPPNSMKP